MSNSKNKVDLIRQAGKEHSQLVTDVEKTKKLCWIQHPYITRYINTQISGNPETDWLTWFKTNYAQKPFEYGLSLGCGTGLVEREVVQKEICRQFDGIDITSESIRIATQSAKENKMEDQLHYSVQDLNKVQLKSKKYDFILISHSLHHIEKLEHVFREIRNALKPEGLILLSEYIGPSQFQFTEEQLLRMNELLESLPKDYRRDLSIENEIVYKSPVIRPTREYMNQVDPSEAIRSEEIIPLLKKYFDIVIRRDYGGTLLQFLLADIAGNFDESKEQDRKILDRLCTIEWNYIKEGKLNSDFAILVVKQKPVSSGFRKLLAKLGFK